MGRWLLALSLASITGCLAARAVAAGRPPLSNQYEFALAFAWSAMVGALLLDRRWELRGLGLVVRAVALGCLLYASALPSTIVPPVPALQSPLILAAHVGSAVVAYGAHAVGFAAGGLLLAQLGAQRWWGVDAPFLPRPRALDATGHAAVMVGFPALTATLLLGSWWSSVTWGTYWSWDPKQSATLATWLIYAVYLHTRLRREWRGAASAALLLLGFAATLFTYAGNLFFDGQHSYAGV